MPFTFRRSLGGRICGLFCLAAGAGVSPARAALDASQVLILVNRDVPISGQVAQMYQRLRDIPESNILRLPMGKEHRITPTLYWSQDAPPIRKYLEEHPEIRCIVTTAGVPYTLWDEKDTLEEIAFDNELAVVLRQEPGDRKRLQPNPLYLNGLNPYGVTDPRLLKMVYVTRLEAPDLATIQRMVDDAIATESNGLVGMAAGDAQGMDMVSGYGEGDATVRAMTDRLGSAGFPVTLDLKQETWRKPANGPGTQAAGAAFYVGWYALMDFQDIFGEQGLARGSIAWHIASQEGMDIWNGQSRAWCVNLLRRGAAVTLGPVREPYVVAFPHGDVMVEALLSGLTVAESYWLALPQVSWAMAIMGDPLYRPFGQHPRPAIVARSYISENSNQILVRGETAPLLVQLECIGPPGSSTPALTAGVETEMGLKAASGPVTIPALKAGESTVVRIPSVTAGDDQTGMFRLRLNTRVPGDTPRRIVVEGRIGFARLTGGLGPKSQLFVSPDASFLISGLAGRSVLIQTSNLRTQPLRLPENYVLSNVEFSPDRAHLALLLADPQKKQTAVVITDDKLSGAQSVPPGTQFLRWLDKDRVLVGSQDGWMSHSISGGEDHNLGNPPSRAGNVIPGTEIQFWSTEEGRVWVKNGADAPREVLRGAKVNRQIAIANDLSLFGGMDAENRLWVQHGFDGEPETIASAVANVLWGPISRKVVVWDANHKARIYDGRDRSWKDLGPVAPLAAWSDDEESLLFQQDVPGMSTNQLVLLSGAATQELCFLYRLGQIQKMVFSADYKRAFLLASLAGELDAWMMPLPPRVPAAPRKQ